MCLYAGTYVDDEVLAHCQPGTQLVDTAYLNLDAITKTLVAAHEAGHDVARLCSGTLDLFGDRRADAASRRRRRALGPHPGCPRMPRPRPSSVAS